ncbi:hypothetical protein [Photobacterium swingsii]|uniref:hypothetical protein n=1 Tax=Photobacterium swingsii TaxID=680026 RepID=UPI000AACF1B3|nr:hypothetical protein [Photobacterium swingsii]
MPRLLILLLFLPLLSWGQESTQMSWLDNRFRVDPTVDQVSFMVKRDKESNSVVLVRLMALSIMRGATLTTYPGTKSRGSILFLSKIQCPGHGKLLGV